MPRLVSAPQSATAPRGGKQRQRRRRFVDHCAATAATAATAPRRRRRHGGDGAPVVVLAPCVAHRHSGAKRVRALGEGTGSALSPPYLTSIQAIRGGFDEGVWARAPGADGAPRARSSPPPPPPPPVEAAPNSLDTGQIAWILVEQPGYWSNSLDAGQKRRLPRRRVEAAAGETEGARHGTRRHAGVQGGTPASKQDSVQHKQQALVQLPEFRISNAPRRHARRAAPRPPRRRARTRCAPLPGSEQRAQPEQPLLRNARCAPLPGSWRIDGSRSDPPRGGSRRRLDGGSSLEARGGSMARGASFLPGSTGSRIDGATGPTGATVAPQRPLRSSMEQRAPRARCAPLPGSDSEELPRPLLRNARCAPRGLLKPPLGERLRGATRSSGLLESSGLEAQIALILLEPAALPSRDRWLEEPHWLIA